MTDTSIFDVLVVYSNSAATSASLKSVKSNHPFDENSAKAIYNEVYGYFLDTCEKEGIKAAFTTSADIIGPGQCKSYWIHESGKWKKVNKRCYSILIFDKFLPRSEKLRLRRQKMFAHVEVKPFTNKHLLKLFSDKLETHSKLIEFSIPTVHIENTKKESIKKSLLSLREKVLKTGRSSDFTNEIILKDRYGSGGFYIFKINTNYINKIQKLMNKNKDVSFIMQPYVKFDRGFKYKNFEGATEMRLIYLNQKIVQTYIRVAGNSDFLCNHGGGGIQIKNSDVPNNVRESAEGIVNKLGQEEALFALDFVVSNGDNVYLLEGNISPGIDWHKNFPKNESMNKEMIRIIVGELSSMSKKAN